MHRKMLRILQAGAIPSKMLLSQRYSSYQSTLRKLLSGGVHAEYSSRTRKGMV